MSNFGSPETTSQLEISFRSSSEMSDLGWKRTIKSNTRYTLQGLKPPKKGCMSSLCQNIGLASKFRSEFSSRQIEITIATHPDRDKRITKSREQVWVSLRPSTWHLNNDLTIAGKLLHELETAIVYHKGRAPLGTSAINKMRCKFRGGTYRCQIHIRGEVPIFQGGMLSQSLGSAILHNYCIVPAIHTCSRLCRRACSITKESTLFQDSTNPSPLCKTPRQPVLKTLFTREIERVGESVSFSEYFLKVTNGREPRASRACPATARKKGEKKKKKKKKYIYIYISLSLSLHRCPCATRPPTPSSGCCCSPDTTRMLQTRDSEGGPKSSIHSLKDFPTLAGYLIVSPDVSDYTHRHIYIYLS